MEKKEAIERLKWVLDDYIDGTPNYKAIQLAIDSLEREMDLPPVQSTEPIIGIPETGTILIAKDECKMKKTGVNALVIGKKYKVLGYSEQHESIFIHSEVDKMHYFYISVLNDYFTLTPSPNTND